jgi:alkylresorcinol/alkylpyrone synthase
MVAASLGKTWVEHGRTEESISRLFNAAGVGTRYLALPLSSYAQERTFAASNDLFIELGTHLAAEAAIAGLDRAGFDATDVDLLVVVTTTGVAAPSLDARMINLVGFRRDVKRLPVVGLGCVGGTAGLTRCMEYVRAAPRDVVLLVCVELCSLTFQRDDASMSNLIATALFGDAAAAAVVAGAERADHGPRLLGSRSLFQVDTEGVLGFTIGDSGFRVVLREDLPNVAGRGLVTAIDRLLADHRLTRGHIGEWIVHPGGPKVLKSVERVLELPPRALERSWNCLRALGNVSSASVLCMLADLFDAPPSPGTYCIVVGMGPGFSAEAVLLRWD